METKFNSQICTTREQSERLLALGLKKETADMHLEYYANDSFNVWAYTIEKSDMLFGPCIKSGCIPAWSLARLVEMIPMTLIEDKVYHERWDLNISHIAVIYRNQDKEDEWIGECMGRGMYDNIIDCIEWLIKEGYFNKEYLENANDIIAIHRKAMENQKKVLIDKATQWLFEYVYDYTNPEDQERVEAFRKYLEE